VSHRRFRKHGLPAHQVFALDLGQRFGADGGGQTNENRQKRMLGRRLPVYGGFRTQALTGVLRAWITRKPRPSRSSRVSGSDAFGYR
jgi:hypothetical protein